MATTLQLATSAVNVTGVTDVAPAAGRRLLQSGNGGSGSYGGSIAVAFSIRGSSDASALLASVSALAADSSSFVAALQSAGITATVTVALPVLTVVAPDLTTTQDAATYYAAAEAGLLALSAANALSVAAQLAGQLNSASSVLNSNASAAADVRASLLTVITSSATAANTTAAVQSAATTVSALVANSSQVNEAGASAALGILRPVSLSGTVNRAVEFTQSTSDAVMGALSSIVDATGAGAVEATQLGTVFTVVNNLAGSQLVGLAAGASVYVSSSAIQMRVAVAASGAALLGTPLSLNGSASAFAPLPAGLFANAGDTSAGVQTQFASLSFDPYVNSTGSGVVRLAFTAPSGAPLEVSGLSTPVYFNLSAVATAPGQKAQCQWWDAAASSYSTVGCAALPNPAPSADALLLFWLPGFVNSTDASIASAWAASGPLAANCSRTVLDCSDANSTQLIFPNPAQVRAGCKRHAGARYCARRLTRASALCPPALRGQAHRLQRVHQHRGDGDLRRRALRAHLAGDAVLLG
jgi:hypothetical protein